MNYQSLISLHFQKKTKKKKKTFVCMARYSEYMTLQRTYVKNEIAENLISPRRCAHEIQSH